MKKKKLEWKGMRENGMCLSGGKKVPSLILCLHLFIFEFVGKFMCSNEKGMRVENWERENIIMITRIRGYRSRKKNTNWGKTIDIGMNKKKMKMKEIPKGSSDGETNAYLKFFLFILFYTLSSSFCNTNEESINWRWGWGGARERWVWKNDKQLSVTKY